MRTLRVVALALGLALAAPAVTETAGASGQVVRGRVHIATGPRLVGPVWVGACGLLDAAAVWATRKGVAYPFHIDASTRGRPFVLDPDLPADLDVTFTGGGGAWYFEARDLAEERGLVPEAAEAAYVCLVAGPPTGFTYAAG